MAQDTRQLLEAKVRDCLRMAQRRPCFLGFLDESQRAQCQDLLKWEKGTSFLFWGGYDQAERTMLGFFPDYLEPSAQEFPLEAVTFRYRAGDKLSHRDFLGSFMALGVERDVLGDILVGEGCCVAFLRREMAPYFLDNIRKIGRVGLRRAWGRKGLCRCAGSFRSSPGWWPLPGWTAWWDCCAAPAGRRPPGSSPPEPCSATTGRPTPRESGWKRGTCSPFANTASLSSTNWGL